LNPQLNPQLNPEWNSELSTKTDIVEPSTVTTPIELTTFAATKGNDVVLGVNALTTGDNCNSTCYCYDTGPAVS